MLSGEVLSRVVHDKDFRMGKSSEEFGERSIESTGPLNDDFRSRDTLIDFRTEEKDAKGLREAFGLGETEAEMGVGCLFGPKGRRERKERRVVEAGVLGAGTLKEGRFEERVGIDEGVCGERCVAMIVDYCRSSRAIRSCSIGLASSFGW